MSNLPPNEIDIGMQTPEMSRKKCEKIDKETRKLVGQDTRHVYDLQFDLFKHLTTLSAGTIVVLAAFLSKEADSSVIGSAILMVITVVIGYLGMMTTVYIQQSVVETAHELLRIHDILIEEQEPSVENVMGISRLAKQLGFLVKMQPLLMVIGSVIFTIGLGMLAAHFCN